MNATVRAATLADISPIMELEEASPSAAHWSRQQYEEIFSPSGPMRIALVIEENGRIEGFFVARAVGLEWEIENTVVAAAARRNGLGSLLLGKFLEIARESATEAVFLEVRESSHAARALYHKWNFIESGSRKLYYRDPEEDAIIYRLCFR